MGANQLEFLSILKQNIWQQA